MVHEVRGRRQQRFLDPLVDAPEDFSVLDPDGEEAEHMPSRCRCRWPTTGRPERLKHDGKRRRPRSRSRSRGRASHVAGDAPQPRTTMTLDPDVTERLRDLLRTSCVVTSTTDDGVEGPLLVIERNHDLKPALIEGIDLTPAEILALWSIPDLRKRLERMGRTPARRGSNEPDLEHGDTTPPAPASMFEQFAGVFHAFASLHTRIREAVAEKASALGGALAVRTEHGQPEHGVEAGSGTGRPRPRPGLRHVPLCGATARVVWRPSIPGSPKCSHVSAPS